MCDDIDTFGYDFEMISMPMGYLETTTIPMDHACTLYALKNKHSLLKSWYKILPPISINKCAYLITGNFITHNILIYAYMIQFTNQMNNINVLSMIHYLQ